ncbi:response regulator transcription factor [Geosporobacter ferrireducens]|uniref:Stage 0 sporulation protein A homolog n=1 Tax=Geosporobacter ferrireducens TaxID=1424294 RepID=A0A1D8GIS8_9FIRM|nr:response regulator [Geosporobacter ferrireducens]AOT70752.1 DNA-binding response regulator [Geosporobacter ferrireducens]
MIKLLIADDEHLVVESIRFIIEKYTDETEVVGIARSGREAIEKAVELKPDIVFMDIRMPGIDGIEAIRQIKATNGDVVFVIVTAYEYFNYAKDAVNLGVHEYLLKPVNKHRVMETVNSAAQLIRSKRSAIQREMLLREKINKIIPHMEGQFVYSQLFSGRIIKDIAFYEEVFAMALGHGYVMMAIVEESESYEREETLKNSLDKQRFYDIFSLELKNLTPCLIGPPMLDRTVAYIPVNMNEDSYTARNMAIEIAQKLIRRINKSINIHYKIGLGRRYDISNFLKSSNEAYMAAAVANKDLMVHYEDVILSVNAVDTYPTNKEKTLIHKMLTGDLNGVLESFEEIFWWLTVNYKDDMDKIKSKLLELLVVVKRSIPYEAKESDVPEQGQFIELLKIQNIRELKASYTNYLKNTTLAIGENREKELSGLILKSLKYINNNYQKNISLDDVAKEVNMSYHYFSKFFKETTGKNFVDYLTEIRIERSKELLKDVSASIKDICHEIGYSDPNYFCKIFKKVTGMTPTEFRSNPLSQEVM